MGGEGTVNEMIYLQGGGANGRLLAYTTSQVFVQRVKPNEPGSIIT